MKVSEQGGGIFNLKELFAHKTSGIHRNGSPFPIDRVTVADEAFDNLRKKTILIDGVFKGDYSLAIVNRQVARALIAAGLNVRVFTREEGWKTDPLLGEMSDVRSRCLEAYPEPASYDIHLRNTWPPAADDMVGRLINAYVCFAWEETAFPPGLVSHFNTYLDLVMVTANFVAESLVNSGVRIPVVTVGNGTDHILKVVRQALAPALQRGPRERILHVSSCFPRKGADALVKAFSATFTRDDNVELFIKTFDNPHNRIDRIVTAAHAAHPEMAPVRVVKQSLASGELAELVRTASLFVAPSRGEGFGLPLAEATLLGVPVVTTNFSGQTDFCTDETAWLVDYQLRPSDAHVTSGGVWADPDIGSLRTQMRAALASHALAEEKVARGTGPADQPLQMVRCRPPGGGVRGRGDRREGDVGHRGAAAAPGRSGVDLEPGVRHRHLFGAPVLHRRAVGGPASCDGAGTAQRRHGSGQRGHPSRRRGHPALGL